jgi:hypothetical protein
MEHSKSPVKCMYGGAGSGSGVSRTEEAGVFRNLPNPNFTTVTVPRRLESLKASVLALSALAVACLTYTPSTSFFPVCFPASPAPPGPLSEHGETAIRDALYVRKHGKVAC